jgi:uncharacterized protein YeaO (DUF488 family)
MGEEPSTSGSAVSVEARDPDKIRREMEATRQELGDTIQALAEKTDVRAQAKHKLEESNAYVSKKKDDLLGKKDDLLAKARETSPESLVSAVHHAAHKARQNPIELAAVSAFALGFVVGRRAKCPTRRSRPS